MPRKKKPADKIVTAELNSLIWQLFECMDEKERKKLTARIVAVYGLIPDTPYSRREWIQRTCND